MENTSEVNEFILRGITDDPKLQVSLFIVLTFIYLITLVGNLGMIALISLDSHFQMPMYFFLRNLSLVDFGYSSSVTPKVMTGLLSWDKVICYNGCTIQFFLFGALVVTESFLLACMAYDRHAAVCKPLHYTSTMTSTLCAQLASGSYFCGFLASSIVTGNMFRLSFCRSNIVQHCFCDVPSLFALSSSDIRFIELQIFIITPFSTLFPFPVILISYLLIFIIILKMHSAEGYQKGFSTCASHLTAVSIFYGTIIFMYFQLISSHSMYSAKILSLCYTMVIPMLNPLVYCLRYKAVKKAFRNVCEKTMTSINYLFFLN